MIAEAFNDFFMSIGPKLSAEINHDALDLSENLSTSPVTLFTLSEISEYKVFLLLLSFQLKCSSNINSMHYLRLTNSFHQVPRDIHTLPVKEPIPRI